MLRILTALLIGLTAAAPRTLPVQEKLKQDVTVTAVEVPVRVLRRNEVVKGLTKADFELFENGVRQDISTFEIVSRRIIGVPDAAPAAIARTRRPRLFILIFNVFDYTEALGEAINYFFKNVFREKDKLALITENRLLNIPPGKKVEDIVLGLKETLKRYKVVSAQNILRAYNELREEADRLLGDIGEEGGRPPNWDQGVTRFYDHYARIWQAYRSQFLTPDAGLYQALIKRTAALDAEKWAICFQQRDLFPELRNQGRLDKRINELKEGAVDPIEQVKARLIQSAQWRLQQEFDLARNFPADTLSDLFVGAGITFHLILMKSTKTLLSEDFDFKEVTAEYEDCFRRISASTGGYLAFSNKALDALKGAAEKEDYHYLLVYQPKGPVERRGKNIEVKVRREGATVYNLKQYLKLGGSVMTITGIEAARKTLRFSLKDYAMVGGAQGPRGVGEVKVAIYDKDSKPIFSEGKMMDFVKDEIHITLNLGHLQPGTYILIIEALDKITNEKDVYSGLIEL